MDSSCCRCGGRGGSSLAPNRQATSPPHRHHCRKGIARGAALPSQALARVLRRPVTPAALVPSPPGPLQARRRCVPRRSCQTVPSPVCCGRFTVQLLENPRQKSVQRPALRASAISSKPATPPRAVCFSLVSPTLARALSGVNDRPYTNYIVFVHSLAWLMT